MRCTDRGERFIINGLILIILSLLVTACSAEQVEPAGQLIHVAKGHSRNYYHIDFTLTPDNLFMTNPLDEKKLVADGGQFEVYINKENFPIKAPYCKKHIILRMPWSKASEPEASRNITEKITLYQTLRAVADGSKSAETVVIELNPYIKVNNTDPLDIELTQCNVFFRSSQGRYINYTGELK